MTEKCRFSLSISGCVYFAFTFSQFTLNNKNTAHFSIKSRGTLSFHYQRYIERYDSSQLNPSYASSRFHLNQNQNVAVHCKFIRRESSSKVIRICSLLRMFFVRGQDFILTCKNFCTIYFICRLKRLFDKVKFCWTGRFNLVKLRDESYKRAALTPQN